MQVSNPLAFSGNGFSRAGFFRNNMFTAHLGNINDRGGGLRCTGVFRLGFIGHRFDSG